MRRTIIAILALFYVVFATDGFTAESRIQGSTTQWRDIVERADFTAIVTRALSKTLPPWPAVHSSAVSLALTQEENQEQQELRALARKIARQLELYQETMHKMGHDQLHQSCRSLIALRDHIMNEPSYVNMVLADAINRVVFVHLARRLLTEKDVSEAMSRNVRDLSRYACSPTQIRTVMVKELGKPIAQGGLDGGEREQFAALLQEFHGEESFDAYVRKFAKAGICQLLEERNVVLLLWRYAFTDTRIKMMLPLAEASMKNLDPGNRGNLSALSQNVKSIDTSAYQSVDAPLLGLRSPTEALRELVRDFQTQRIQQFPQFDTSPSALQQGRSKAWEVAAMDKTPSEKCSENRQMIHWAKEQAAIVLGKQKGQALTVDDLRPYLQEKMLPTCPEGGTYVIGVFGSPPKCSIHGDHGIVGAE